MAQLTIVLKKALVSRLRRSQTLEIGILNWMVLVSSQSGPMLDKGLLVIAAVGLVICSLITLTAASKDTFFELLLGTLLGWVPYLATIFVSRGLKLSKELIASVKGGLILYIIIDSLVRYKGLHHPESSTDGIAIMIILILSVIIIPVGTAITYVFVTAKKNSELK